MNGTDLIRCLHDGTPAIGTLIVSPAPEWPMIVGKLGLDFVFIDTEHIALDRSQLSWMCRAYAAMGLAPIVRVPSPEANHMHIAIDAGAAGVIVPYVESVEVVRQLVAAVKYKPLKGEKLASIMAGGSCDAGLQDYLQRGNVGRAAIVNIESVAALDALDDILDVPGVDALLVGPHDLSCSLDVPEQWTDPTFLEAIDTIIVKARAKNVGVGVHGIWHDVLDQEIRWAKSGANLLIHQADLIAVQRQIGADVRQLREAVGAGQATREHEAINI